MLKRRILRFFASFNKKKVERHLKELTEEQRFVYNIAMRLLALSSSVLETNPTTNIIYVKNDLKLIKIDPNSIHFVNGKYSYSFPYENCLIQELKRVFYRHKEMSIKHMIDEISEETTGHLKKIYEDLTRK